MAKQPKTVSSVFDDKNVIMKKMKMCHGVILKMNMEMNFQESNKKQFKYWTMMNSKRLL